MKTIADLKVYCSEDDHSYASWLVGAGATLVDRVEDASLLLMTGGVDVSPSVYGEPAHPYTGNDPARDERERVDWDKAQVLGIHVLGVCGGAQRSCAFSGGRLVQHQLNPAAIHPIETSDGRSIPITSTHHQAMHQWNLPARDWKLLAWTRGMSPYHQGGRMEEMVLGEMERVTGGREIEIATIYPTRVLSVQGHPEYLYGCPGYDSTIEYVQSLLTAHINGTL